MTPTIPLVSPTSGTECFGGKNPLVLCMLLLRLSHAATLATSLLPAHLPLDVGTRPKGALLKTCFGGPLPVHLPPDAGTRPQGAPLEDVFWRSFAHTPTPRRGNWTLGGPCRRVSTVLYPYTYSPT